MNPFQNGWPAEAESCRGFIEAWREAFKSGINASFVDGEESIAVAPEQQKDR